MLRTLLRLVASVGLGLVVAGTGHAQHEEIRVFSTQPGGGQLVSDFDFTDARTLPSRLSFCPGGTCLYADGVPGIVAPATDAGDGLHALLPGTEVSFVLQAIDAAISVKVGARILRQAGEAAVLGKADFHSHPEWQLTLPEGLIAEQAITFALRASNYQDSPAFTLLVTNELQATATPTSPAAATATPSATASPTASASPTGVPPTSTPAEAPACAGDCNEDYEVTVDEIVRGVSIALGDTAAEQCRALDANGDGEVTVDELVRAIQSALDGCT